MMQTYITLNDGTRIPQFGLGVYQVPEGEATFGAVRDALALGVRHIDTAHAYQNERSVGRAVKASGIPREEIWITSKLWPHEYGEGKTAAAIDKMLARLDLDHIDLLLLHQQFGDYLGAWRDMEKAVAA
ncbi:MAG: aldo/keto reductase, partial [Oscillospiraceae bacterium]|nr:aldo/keto reductase [Oscillospiraceae bacterium]